MTMGGTDISTYGLKLIKASGFSDLPRRKKILKEPGFEAKDIKYQEKKVTVELLGKYVDQSTLASNIDSLKTRLEDGLMQFDFPEIGETVFGRCIDGVNVKVYKNLAVCKFEIRH